MINPACFSVVIAAFAIATSLPVGAQPYPSRPISMIVPLQAGSSADAIFRVVAQRMAENMGQQVVIENQPGAAGVIGTERVARAAPDGYTLAGLNDGVLTMLPHLRPKLGYDPVASFEPISLLAEIEWVLIGHPGFAAKDVAGLVAAARQRPGRIDYSSGGNGSPQHIAMEVFKAATGTFMTHIPYKGATQSAMDVMSGQIPVSFSGLSIVISNIRAGKLVALGIANPKRSPLLPDVPTIGEAGVPGFQFATWGAILAPKGTPKAIVDRLNAEAVKALSDPGVRDRLQAQGLVPRGTTPDELARAIPAGLERMGKVIRAAGIRIE